MVECGILVLYGVVWIEWYTGIYCVVHGMNMDCMAW